MCRVNFNAVWFQPAILFTVQWIFNNEKYCCKSLHAINFNNNNSASLLGNKSLILENILSFSIHCSPTKMHQHLKFVQCLVFKVTPYKKQNKCLSWLAPVVFAARCTRMRGWELIVDGVNTTLHKTFCAFACGLVPVAFVAHGTSVLEVEKKWLIRRRKRKIDLIHNTFRYRADGEIKKTGNQSVLQIL